MKKLIYLPLAYHAAMFLGFVAWPNIGGIAFLTGDMAGTLLCPVYMNVFVLVYSLVTGTDMLSFFKSGTISITLAALIRVVMMAGTMLAAGIVFAAAEVLLWLVLLVAVSFVVDKGKKEKEYVCDKMI